jgi:hypothetical protein
MFPSNYASGDRTPKQKVKLKVTEEKLLKLLLKYNGGNCWISSSGMALTLSQDNEFALLNDAAFLYYFPVYLYSEHNQFLKNWIKA